MSVTLHGAFVAMTVVDGAQKSSIVTLELRGVTDAHWAASAAAIVDAYQALTDAIVVGYHIVKKYSVDGADPTGAVGFNSMKAVLSATVDGNPLKKVSLDVTDPAVGMWSGAEGTPGFNVVNIAYSPLVTYTDLFKAAAGNTGGYISDGESIQAVVDGVRVSRGRRNP